MSPLFLKLVSLLLIGMAVWGLVAGKVMAGSRGFKPNFYTKQDNLFLFYGFIFIYLMGAAFLWLQTA